MLTVSVLAHPHHPQHGSGAHAAIAPDPLLRWLLPPRLRRSGFLGWKQPEIQALRKLQKNKHTPEAPLLERRHEGSPFVIVFVPVDVDGEPVAFEHTGIEWGRPAKIAKLPLAPRDR